MAGKNRRDLLRIGAVVGFAALVMARPWQGLIRRDLAFEELPGLPLRRLVLRGQSSGRNAGQAVFAGLSDGPSGAERAARARLEAEPCTAFGLPWPEGAPVPVTYFTDIRCPSCRVLESDLSALVQEGLPMRVTTREFPVFGARSRDAARAIVAAGPDAEAVRSHLRTRPAPTAPEAAARMAETLGLDADAYVEAWRGPEATERLAEDAALASLIALPGTPGLVVGRTVVIGAQPRATLRRVVKLESAEGAPAECA